MSDNPNILIGEIVAAQGLRGQVRVNVPSGNPQDLAEYSGFTDQHGNPVFLRFHSAKGQQAVISVKGATDRNAAEALVGTKLYIARDTLPSTPEGSYYFVDLVGLEVRDGSGKLGVIKAMHNFGAGDIMELTLNNGKQDMLPFNKQVVREVNVPEGYVFIEMPEIIMVQQ